MADVLVHRLRQVVNGLVGVGGHAGALEGLGHLEQEFVLRGRGGANGPRPLQTTEAAGRLVDVEAIGAGKAG